MSESDLGEHQRRLADAAFEEYDFGDGVHVESSDSWSVDDNGGEDDFVKVVYVSCEEDPPETDSRKVSFHVRFAAGTPVFIEAYAYSCDNGAEFGHLPEGFVARREARLLTGRMEAVLSDTPATSRPSP